MVDHKAETERILKVGSSETTTGEDAVIHAILALVDEVELLKEVIAADRCGIGSLLEELGKQVKRVADAMEARLPAEQPDSFLG